MSCDAQTLVNLSATDKLAGLSRRGIAEGLAYQSAQHSGGGGSTFTYAPSAAVISWTDTNGAHSGNLAVFNATADFASVTAMDFSGKGITSIAGPFSSVPSLTSLLCPNNTLTALDLTGAPSLTTLDCSGNQLASITSLSSCTGLVSLDGSDNLFTSLDLGFMPPAVQAVSVASNPLLASVNLSSVVTASIGLNITSCPSLTTITANALTHSGSIVIDNNAALISVSLSALTTCGPLGVSGNAALTTLNLNSLVTVANFQGDSDAVASLSLPALVTCSADFFCNPSPALTTFSAPNWVMAGTNEVNLSFCGLGHTSIEGVLRRGVISGVTSYGFDFSDGTNAGLASLSVQGQTDAAALVTAGNTVALNP